MECQRFMSGRMLFETGGEFMCVTPLTHRNSEISVCAVTHGNYSIPACEGGGSYTEKAVCEAHTLGVCDVCV